MAFYKRQDDMIGSIMPMDSIKPGDKFRALAQKWQNVADAADRAGDTLHREDAEIKVATYRRKAREADCGIE